MVIKKMAYYMSVVILGLLTCFVLLFMTEASVFGEDKEPLVLYTTSNGSLREISEGGEAPNVSTGIVTSSSEALSHGAVRPGKVVHLTFSHSLFANQEVSGINASVSKRARYFGDYGGNFRASGVASVQNYRTKYGDTVSYYSISAEGGVLGSGSTSGSQSWSNLDITRDCGKSPPCPVGNGTSAGAGYYSAEDNYKQQTASPNLEYFSRDFYTITPNVPGTYYFYHDLYASGKGASSSAYISGSVTVEGYDVVVIPLNIISGQSIGNMQIVDSNVYWRVRAYESDVALWSGYSNYAFIGWHTSSSIRKITDLSSTDYYYDVYPQNKNSDIIIYAYYIPAYTLSITEDYADAKVIRIKSPYGGGSTNTELGDGATIYYGDELEISFSKEGEDCSDWVEHSVDGSNVRLSEYTMTVSSNVSVVAKAQLRAYKLTKRIATGTTISVYRNKSQYVWNGVPLSNGSRASSVGNGYIDSGAMIYCGDELNTTFSLLPHYSWGNYSGEQKGWHFKGDGIDIYGPYNTNNDTKYIGDHYVKADVLAETMASPDGTVVRDEFSGRARANAGSNVNGSNDTGWVESDKTVSTSIECLNSGCGVSFDLSLKTDRGTGATSYRKGTSLNGGSTLWVPGNRRISLGFRQSEESIVGSGTYTLLPGQSRCDSLEFQPFGEKSDDYWATPVSACVGTIVSQFEGRSNVSGAVNGTTDWSGNNNTVTVPIQNCSAVTGCSVTISHDMRRTVGIGSSEEYVVSRESNLKSSPFGYEILDNDKLASGDFDGDQANIYTSESLTLFPGMVVCERISFKPNNNVVINAEKVISEICVAAEGNAQPPDTPSGDDPSNPESDPNGDSGNEMFLNMEVKNNSVNKYNTFRKVVYAKPEDNLTYRGEYNPVLQYTYYLIPEQIRVKGGSGIVPLNGRNKTFLMYTLYNTNRTRLGNNLGAWNNDFYVESLDFYPDSQFAKNYSYKNGTTNYRSEVNDHRVSKNEVGSVLREQSYVNNKAENKTTPAQVSFSLSGGNNVGTIDPDERSSIAYAYIPYNYIQDSEVVSDQDTVPAGGEMTVEYVVNTNPKPNDYTTDGSDDEAYATIVREAKERIIVFMPESGTTRDGAASWGNSDSNFCASYYRLDDASCNVVTPSDASDNITYNPFGKLEGDKASAQKTVNVPDMVAGTEFCVSVAVYPANSGDDKNMNAAGSGTWNVSKAKCFKIAKRPNLQVWGGGVYSAGKIDTGVSKKTHVAGANNYSVVGGFDSYHVFGSWAELNISSLGTVNGFASGASTGYAVNNNGVLQPNPTPPDGLGNTGNVIGGSTEENLDFCVRSVLTIANDRCSGSTGVAGGMGGSAIGAAEKNKTSLIDRFIGNRGDGRIDYEERSANQSLSGITVSKGRTKVIKVSGDMTIDGDISFLDSESYVTLSDVPKLILYANNIKISCTVNRIDAVLIAENDVDTCYESDDIDSEINSNQLKINGSVITDSLTAKRTYGASTGANSIVPAEIVNYDSTLYLWGATEADVTKTAKITTTYTRELSPRY